MLNMLLDQSRFCYFLEHIAQFNFLDVLNDRILDNLPVVVPLRRSDQDSTPVYQLGFHVGLKGHYSGVCSLITEQTSHSLFIFIFIF